jgi:simple sugar transport system permease protein
MKHRLSDLYILALITVVIVLLMSVLNPRQFLTIANLESMAFQLPELGLLSMAMMITMLTGGINLSIIATANMTGIVAALILTSGHSQGPADVSVGTLLLAISAGLAVAIVIGLINGLLIALLGVSPILATLGMMTLVDGLGIVFTRGYVVSGFPEAIRFLGNGTVAGIPFGVFLLALAALLLAVLLNRTSFGFNIYMIGCNPTATYFSGVNNNTVIIRTYILSSVYAGFAALIMMSRFNSVSSAYGKSYLLITILCSVLGGISASGGFGRVSGLILALTVLQIVSSGLNLLQVSSFLTIAIWGCIIVIVMAINYLVFRFQERSMSIKRGLLSNLVG